MLYVYADETRTVRLVIDSKFLDEEAVQRLAVDLSDTEVARSVDFARAMDDGEAQALAIAVERSVPMLSDDAAAARQASGLSVTLETTLDLMFAWGQNVEERVVAQAARALRLRANYAPPRAHALREWYIAIAANGDSV